VTPAGRFLYGSERKTSTLASYRIDPDKGTLSPIGHFPTETAPRGFNINPRSRFLLSVGLDSNAMRVYRIVTLARTPWSTGEYREKRVLAALPTAISIRKLL